VRLKKGVENMASFIDDLLGSELNLMFFISMVVWSLLFLFLYYLNNKLINLKRELKSLEDD